MDCRGLAVPAAMQIAQRGWIPVLLELPVTSATAVALHSPLYSYIYLCETRFALVDHVVDHASGHVERAFLLLTSNVRPARFAQPALLQVERDGRAKQRHCAGTDICL